MARPFGSLLVANRGEIALRVIRGARGLGLRTVAVYSDADREAPHVHSADTAVYLGPTPATESYLSIPALLHAAEVSSAEAIHPGYGFLSERAEFARAVADAGLILIGPSAEVMEQMGRKDLARGVAEAAGVPVVPSYAVDSSPDHLDYPVLVKAASGGGGKGMRIVRTAAEFPGAVEAARREAASAFGDDTLLIEKYVERGRHIEVQVLGDTHGHVVHLRERDCSTQRRHQKVLEEAPAPTLDEAQRDLLTSSAVALAREVGYVNAGTVEFLVDDDSGAGYFLEMNTRLQVEHPVTEQVVRISGRPLDLVEQQLRVAMGQPLDFTQADVSVEGHAIEARIYAEDAYHGFLPQAGRADLVRWSDRARNDVALASGQEVPSAYDPMLGKVIVHGPNREAARRKLVAALDDTAILGLTTNLGFVRELAAGPAFRDCAIDTAWLDRNPELIRRPNNPDAVVFAVWAIADSEIWHRPDHPFGTADGWRLSGPSARASIPLVDDGTQVRWSVSWRNLVGPDREVQVRLAERVPTDAAAGSILRLEIDGRVRAAAVRVTSRHVDVVHRGNSYRFDRPDPFAEGLAGPGDGSVTAPMPGTILAVDVAEGQVVQEGDRLGVVEAMKMELALKAPFTGTVTGVDAVVGKQVALGAVLFVMEEDADA